MGARRRLKGSLLALGGIACFQLFGYLSSFDRASPVLTPLEGPADDGGSVATEKADLLAHSGVVDADETQDTFAIVERRGNFCEGECVEEVVRASRRR